MMVRLRLLQSIYLLVCLNMHYLVRTEMFTAIVDMVPLIETHDMFISIFKTYVDKSQKNQEVLKKLLEKYENEHKKALEDIPKFLGNPINAYKLIKRLTIDLKLLENEIGGKIVNRNNNILKFPSAKDLEGASEAIVRLRSTYRLNIAELANGILNSSCINTGQPYLNKVSPMSAGDCYELGLYTYNNMNYLHSVAWLLEAFSKYDQESNLYNVTDQDILGYIHNVYSILGDHQASAEWYEMLIAPRPEKYKWFINRHRESLALKFIKIHDKEDVEVKEIHKSPRGSVRSDMDKKLMFEHLCRGDQEVSLEKSKSLKCYYTSGPHPSLSVAPVKTELLHRAPNIILFHDIISDDEIRSLLNISIPRLSRATVINANTGYLELCRERVSKFAEILCQESHVARKLSKRISAITGFNMATAEGLQTINYGIGGHFAPHFDYFSNLKNTNVGDRIATVLFFFSDVALGGATVFTELGLTVHPVKGNALFWMNLHPSGKGDNATRHGGCPVLDGIKWVGSYWMHEIGQELVKPCKLKRN